ncbi:MAG: hypothetical protein ICV54_26765 [Nostoc sp. C3-bin3]|nr:hypothetical protein [Nostoc sp. C3-bin3]
MGWLPLYSSDILNGFFHNPSHGCDPRSNIKNIQESDRLSTWTGKKSEATG